MLAVAGNYNLKRTLLDNTRQIPKPSAKHEIHDSSHTMRTIGAPHSYWLQLCAQKRSKQALRQANTPSKGGGRRPAQVESVKYRRRRHRDMQTDSRSGEFSLTISKATEWALINFISFSRTHLKIKWYFPPTIHLIIRRKFIGRGRASGGNNCQIEDQSIDQQRSSSLLLVLSVRN